MQKKEEIIKISESNFVKLKKFTKHNTIITFYSSKDKFILEKMGGVSGYCIDQNNITILINFQSRYWKKALRETIVHEFAHSVSGFYIIKKLSILDGIVFEGIAEHFREDILGGKRAPWTKSVSKIKAKEYFKKLESKLDISSDQLYAEIFFGKGKYPLWLGYSIGYYLIGDYLEKITSKKIWNKILKISPKSIIKKSGWL